MSGIRLTDAQRLDWLRLIRSENVGPRTFRALVNQFGGASAALAALPDLARRGGGPRLRIANRSEAERELEGLARLGGRLLALGEPDYPKTLQAIEGAPPLLAVRGDPAILSRPAVAIVGSRNASAAGLTFTERLGQGLGEAGLAIVSGLARGIDTRAHKASLGTGTVAVLAGGHDGSTCRTKRNCSSASSARAGRRLRRCRSAGGRGGRTFPAGTGSCPACPTASWWWRRRAAPAR